MKNIFKKLNVREPHITPDQKKEIWDKIAEETILKDARRKAFRKTLVKLTAVAAIFALIAINVWFFFSYNKIENDIDYSSYISNADSDALAGGNVTLILSDKEQIDVHTDTTEVVYDADGRVKVNSEELESKEDGGISMNQLIVPHGKTSYLTLSDGTKVWINSGTKLIYPSVFDKKKREVYVSGEAYFDVTKNENHPFVIKTSQIDVTVKGTQLNVSAYGDDSEQAIVLVSGKISVNNKEQKSSYDIEPNQRFSYNAVSKETDIKTVDVNNYISWKNGYLLLQSESLDKVIAKIDRHFNAFSQYNKVELEGIRVSGKLDMRKDLEKVLEYLSTTAPIDYSVDGNNIVIKLKSGEK